MRAISFRKERASDLVLAFTAVLVSIPLVLVVADNELVILAKIGFTGLLVWIAIQDFRTQTVSPYITLAWIGMGIVRGILLRDPSFLPFWFVVFLLWSLHFYGGGDAKLLMGLFGLMPDVQMLWIVCIVLVVAGIPMLGYKYRYSSPRVLADGLSERIMSGEWLPTDQELNQGVPFAFAYCVAGAIYLWLLR